MSSPALFGVPVATWALIVSLFSFSIAVFSLGWQVVKHFLDGGRVRVYLNVAIWEPGSMLVTNRSGRHALRADNNSGSVVRGRALELAQLVVENPGKVPVTIYSPGLSITGHGKKDHTLVPRLFATESSFGPEEAVTDTVVRLEPYGRVTFLLDYWSVIPDLMKDASKDRVFLRGHVGVAGRTKRPQKSIRRLRWRIERGAYTAIVGSPDFTPFAVIWRELYTRLPAHDEDQSRRHLNAGPPITRGMAGFLLDDAMSCFAYRPERDKLMNALDEAAKRYGDRLPMIGLSVFEAYKALDRMEGHLTGWKDGLFRASRDEIANSRERAPEGSGAAETLPPADDQWKPPATDSLT